jgi:hypothetical protein
MKNQAFVRENKKSLLFHFTVSHHLSFFYSLFSFSFNTSSPGIDDGGWGEAK